MIIYLLFYGEPGRLQKSRHGRHSLEGDVTEDDDDDINEMQIVILLNQPCSSNPNKTQLN